MMKELVNWVSRLAVCYILCLLIVAQSTCAHKGFVSITCCAKSNYTDGANNISWITDHSWFPDRTSCKKVVTKEVNYTTEYNNARVFNIVSGKRCFTLPTTEGEDYLIRGTFLFGDTLDISRGSSFPISVGATQIGLVNSSKNLEVEGIFRANKNHIDFCLVRKEGTPYISKLELRPLQDLEYLHGFPSSILKLVKRTNLGSKGDDIRFPSDPTDRIWKPISNIGFKRVPDAKVSNYNGIVKVPLVVLQTFSTDSEWLEIFHDDLDLGDFEYRLSLYFLELDKTVQPGQRVFDIYLNNDLRSSIDTLANGSNYKEAVFNFRANGSLNLTLIRASGSVLGPICNAYEIFQVHVQAEGTGKTDDEVIHEVKKELLLSNHHHNKALQSWFGDPCIPVPWDCLSCGSVNGSTVITKLDLSSSALRGPIPSSFTKLTSLSNLNLSYNGFIGKIPSFPPSSMLRSMDFSHNDLQGPIPRSLLLLPQLKTLYFGCNPDLVKELPTSFNTSELYTDSGICHNEGPRSLKRGIFIGSVAGASVLLTTIVGIGMCFYRKKMMPRRRFNSKGLTELAKNVIISLPSIHDIDLKSIFIETFTLEYIEAATKHYKILIGEGGFGSVYHGILPDGREVAVKVRSATSTQGTREFDNELNLLSAIHHENLVPLLGYCSENDQEILVYPFMSNGSLQDRLYGEAAKRKILDWPTRLSIALGAARGLTFLHTFSGRCIIHRDVKSSNILLDQSMCAKVADFGFSKYAPQEGDSCASLEVRGTAGYLDPEYYMTHHLSAKSDVFSFGVVLLEIVSGREPLDIHRPRSEWSLVEWAKPYIRESKIEEIVDPNIKGGYHAEAMWRVVEVALACIEPFSVYRPCMIDIVRELEDALIIENNASEYMRSIESTGSNNFSIVLEKRIIQPSSSSEPSPIPPQVFAPPEPR